MTLATLMPYLLVVGGYLIRHFDLLGKAASLLGGSNPLAGPTPAPTPVPAPKATGLPLPAILGNHPVLSDAVSAAIKQAVSDAVSGHMTSVQSEIQSAVAAAVAAAVADMKKTS